MKLLHETLQERGHVHTILSDKDMQHIREEVERVKLRLSIETSAVLNVSLADTDIMHFNISRKTFEDITEDLLMKVLEPIEIVLRDVEMVPSDIEEVVLVGGSTRIPRVRELITEYFSLKLNTDIDPEIAVASGVSIQAGILGGMWPLTVSAIELPSRVKKIQLR